MKYGITLFLLLCSMVAYAQDNAVQPTLHGELAEARAKILQLQDDLDSLYARSDFASAVLNSRSDSLQALVRDYKLGAIRQDSILGVRNEQIAQLRAQLASGGTDTSYVLALRDSISEILLKYKRERVRNSLLDAKIASITSGLDADQALESINKSLKLKLTDLQAEFDGLNVYVDTLKAHLTNRISVSDVLYQEIDKRDKHIAELANELNRSTSEITRPTQSLQSSSISSKHAKDGFKQVVLRNEHTVEMHIKVDPVGTTLGSKNYVIGANQSIYIDPLRGGGVYKVHRKLNYGTEQPNIGDYLIVVPNNELEEVTYVFRDLQPGIINNISGKEIVSWAMTGGSLGTKLLYPGFAFCEVQPSKRGELSLTIQYYRGKKLVTKELPMGRVDNNPADVKFLGPDNDEYIVGFEYFITSNEVQ